MKNGSPNNRSIGPNNRVGDTRNNRLLTVLLTSVQGEVLWRYELDISSVLSVPEIADVVPKLLAVRKNLTGENRTKTTGPHSRVLPWEKPEDLPEYLRRK